MKATDGSSQPQDDTLNVTVNVLDVNEPPVTHRSFDNPTMDIGDDLDITLSDHFSDPDANDRLNYFVSPPDTGVATAVVARGVLTVTAVAGGDTTITVTAYDANRLSVSQSFTLTVRPAISIQITLDDDLKIGTSHQLLVRGSNFDPSLAYSAYVSVNNDNAAFGSTCPQPDATNAFPATGASRTASFLVLGCERGPTTVTAEIRQESNTLATATKSITVVGPPDKPVITRHTTGNGTITLTYELGSDVNSFVVQQYQGTTARPLSFNGYSADITPTSAIITGLANGVEYRYRIRSTNDYGTVDSDHYVVPLQALPPATLDLVPLPLRKARLSWDTSQNVPGTQYTVEIRPKDSATATITVFPGPFTDIDLDDVMKDPAMPGKPPRDWERCPTPT